MSNPEVERYTMRCYKKLSEAADQLRALLTTTVVDEEASDIFAELRGLEVIMDRLEERYHPAGKKETS